MAPTPEEEVLAAYQAYWAAVDEAHGRYGVDADASTSGDWEDPVYQSRAGTGDVIEVI